MAAKWKEPPRDALDTLVLTAVDLPSLNDVVQVREMGRTDGICYFFYFGLGGGERESMSPVAPRLLNPPQGCDPEAWNFMTKSLFYFSLQSVTMG